MTMEISNGTPVARTTAPRRVDARELVRMRTRELEPLFARGSIARVDELGVNPRGHVLAIPLFGLERGVMLQLTRLVTGSPLFAWEGKSFYAKTATEGRGENRLRLPLRRGLFSYRTAITRSLVDGAPALSIDYNVPENPSFAHGIYDEVRAIGGGMYLGRGMQRVKNGAPKLLLWFALDATKQDRAIR